MGCTGTCMFWNQNFARKKCFDCFHTLPSLWKWMWLKFYVSLVSKQQQLLNMYNNGRLFTFVFNNVFFSSKSSQTLHNETYMFMTSRMATHQSQHVNQLCLLLFEINRRNKRNLFAWIWSHTVRGISIFSIYWSPLKIQILINMEKVLIFSVAWAANV